MTIQGPRFNTGDFRDIDDPNYSSTYSIKNRDVQSASSMPRVVLGVLHMEYVELRLLKIPVSILVPYSVTLGLEFLYMYLYEVMLE